MLNIGKVLVLVLLFAAARGVDSAGSKVAWPWDDPKVETVYGTVEGKIVDGVAVFYNVPFAAPPVGENRFKPPQPFQGNWPGVRDAKGVPKLCPQLKLSLLHLGSEDCLYLHVYVPANALKDTTKLPVMFWIFGGGYSMGDAFEFGMYDGVKLAKNTNTIVVATNYRVGPFGFLAHEMLKNEDPDGSTGNMGVRDQRAALEFVQENIERFGGDKAQVTIFGESAGAFSVCWHLASERSKGLFHAAISESGSCDTNQFFRPWKLDAQFGSIYAAKFGCNDTAMAQDEFLTCIRKVPYVDIMNGILSWLSPHWPNTEATKYFARAGEGFGKHLSSVIPPLAPVMPWGPSIDGTEVGTFEMPLAALIHGRGSSVPSIFGSNKDEGTIFVPAIPIIMKGISIFPLTDANVKKVLLKFLRDNATFVEKAMEIYPNINDDNLERVAKILRDCTFACPARRAARAMNQRGVKSWLYHFVLPTKNFPQYDLLGNYHSSELSFVFGNQLPFNAFNEDEKKMNSAFQFYWSNLAKTGDVNGVSQRSKEESFLDWPEYNSTTELNMNMDWPLDVQKYLYQSQCDFWDSQAQVPH